MWKFLILLAINNQPVSCQVVLSYQVLHVSHHIHQEWIGRIEVSKGTIGFLWNDDYVEWVIGFGVQESQQGLCLS